MPAYPSVLAITKRPADLCTTQSLLDAAGYKLLAATNIGVARSMIKVLRIKAVIVCRGSWSNDEVQEIASELKKVLGVTFISNHQSPEVMQRGKQSLDLPPAAVSPEPTPHPDCCPFCFGDVGR